jgi:DHA2 family multidrug resistance protein
MMNSKGERLDWFDSGLVRAFAVIAAVSLVSLVLWEWRHKDPVVEVRLFRRSSFAISFLMMFAVGFVLYSSTTVLPLLLQGVHGYTAFTAGLVLMPGGIATFLFMQPIGAATKHVQLRFILGFGLLAQGMALIHMSGFAPDVTYEQAAWARVYQSAFIGAMFIPASTLMYEGLPPGKSNSASALVNIARNIGGSFGIAMANTILARRTALHQSRLIEHVTPYHSGATGFTQSLESYFQGMGSDPVQASQQALGALYQSVAVQAYLKAFCDLFFVLGIVSIGMLVLIPLLPRSKSGGMAAGH